MSTATATLREEALRLISQKPMTTLEVAEAMGVPFESIQPRTSELRREKRIFDSGVRSTRSRSGKNTIVWSA